RGRGDGRGRRRGDGGHRRAGGGLGCGSERLAHAACGQGYEEDGELDTHMSDTHPARSRLTRTAGLAVTMAKMTRPEVLKLSRSRGPRPIPVLWRRQSSDRITFDRIRGIWRRWQRSGD